jgi:Fe-S oxidoreductase
MTTTYNPHDARYLDEKDTRDEMTRVFDVCQGCRLCADLCVSFPTLFAAVDAHADRDVGRLTTAQQDKVVDECWQCKLCFVRCPYRPGRHERAIDFPKLMQRATAMRQKTGQLAVRGRITTALSGRAGLVGRVGTVGAPLVNRVFGAKPGSATRKVVERATGLSSQRLLPPFRRQRFSSWMNQRAKLRLTDRQGAVAVFPTCTVEYHAPEIGKDLVKVYERNGVECTLAAAGCCGAPYLHGGDIERFTKIATQNVAALAAEVRGGRDIVVAQPTCHWVIRNEYPDYVPGADAAAVAERTCDAAEFLTNLHRGERTRLNTTFPGRVPAAITYHVPCHVRAQEAGLNSRDLLRLTGAKVTTVQQCSGVGDGWGWRGENAGRAIPIAQRLAERIDAAGGDVVVGDCDHANTAIEEQRGLRPLHPLQVLARAYGIEAD